jgi:hypothetical protein
MKGRWATDVRLATDPHLYYTTFFEESNTKELKLSHSMANIQRSSYAIAQDGTKFVPWINPELLCYRLHHIG